MSKIITKEERMARKPIGLGTAIKTVTTALGCPGRINCS